MLKRILSLLVAATSFLCPCFAQPGAMPVDRLMGDWQGTVTLDGQTRNAAVYMIPLGESRYEARAVADFAHRGPYLFRLRGTVRGTELRFLDDVSLDTSRVVGSTRQGVIFDTSFWSGSVDGSALQGTVEGKRQGRFELKQIKRVSPTLGKRPPEAAVVLFDGANFDAWKSGKAEQPIKWKLLSGGIMQVDGGGNIMTKEEFGDLRLHIEFCLPYMPHDFGQKRGNSGVYLQSRYEVQVLDSYGLEGADNECGGIYQIARPLVNMCAPPLQWQTYDITFHAAKTDSEGKKTANARITVIHNGTVIHDNLELPKVTGGAISDKEGQPAGLLLQDHGNPVQYRNIWVERL